MAVLSQLDINTYLQLARCCYSDLSVKFANDLNYGTKCTIKDRINLATLGVLLEILSCYRVDVEVSEVLPTAIAYGSYSDLDSTYTLGNGSTILSSINNLTELNEFVALFNSTITGYSIVGNDIGDGEYSITFTGPCSGASVESSNKATPPIVFSEGTCAGIIKYDNCYTEEEIQILIQNIGVITGICFKPIGYTYEIPEGYVLVDGVLVLD